jgi:hypothetical protein
MWHGVAYGNLRTAARTARAATATRINSNLNAVLLQSARTVSPNPLKVSPIKVD